MSLAVVRGKSMEARCKLDYFIVRKLFGDCNCSARAGCDASGISLSSYSAEEIAKKQRDKSAFHCLISFIESGDAPQRVISFDSKILPP